MLSSSLKESSETNETNERLTVRYAFISNKQT